MVWSPRKRRLAMLRRYQARGKARISLSRLMSYLKEAEPMSHTAEGRIRDLFTKAAPCSPEPNTFLRLAHSLRNPWKTTPPSPLVPEILMRVVSILPPLAGIKISVNVGPPLRLILDKLTFTNSRLMLRESFLPVTEDGSSSTAC